MCGFAGFAAKPNAHLLESEQIMTDMLSAIQHRGPDGQGQWSELQTGLCIGHRRLAIQDLSEHGHQPMQSSNQRYVIAFNGEIYNFQTLRKQLQAEGYQQHWRGHSDTEVLLAAIQFWGLDAALEASVGMFAFALYDRQEQQLLLARDRMGEKPLYYGLVGGHLLFASELKALTRFPDWHQTINRNALALLLRHNYIPEPHSIYEQIHKLPPGCYVRFTLNDRVLSQPKAYWSMRQLAETSQTQPFQGSEQQALHIFEKLLNQAVQGQMLADVPLGAFLSGGIDSSLVVAMMQQQSSLPVRSFAIGFEEKDYNEAEYAKAVAAHIGTQHTELYINAGQVRSVIETMPQVYDEPFADPSQLPTLLVAQMTRQHVTVALSGDGGDELFGGYTRYQQTLQLWRFLRLIPAVCRPLLKRLLQSLPVHCWDSGFRLFAAHISALQKGRGGDRIHKLADILNTGDMQGLYRNMMSYWLDPEQVVLDACEPETALNNAGIGQDALQRMMYQDAVTYLPDDILVKVDRASMAVSLETRIPLLDHRIVEFAWSLPLSMRMQQGQGKWLLRQLLFQHVPKALLDRPKAGFAVPLESWLRGDLREWAADLLSPDSLNRQGFFNVSGVQKKWSEHCSGKRNWHFYLWSILMFQQWLQGQNA